MFKFISKNRNTLLIISGMLLILFGVWKFNIYQIWFYLTPQENLGSPPKRAIKVVDLKPTYDYAVNRLRTYVFVQTEDNEVYRCCSWHDTKDWVKQDNYQIKDKQEEKQCSKRLSERWKLPKTRREVVASLSLGQCGDSSLSTYSSYHIEQDGIIKGKTIQENLVLMLFEMSFFLCIRPTLTALFIGAIFILFLKKNTTQYNQENNEQIS